MTRFRVVSALVLVQVLFGVHYFVAKLILGMMPPLAWAAVRILGAAILLMGYNLLFRRRHPGSLADLCRLALYAVFGVVINQVLFVEGLSRTTPSHSAVINSSIPVATLGFAIAFGQERPSWRKILALVAALSSVLMLLGIERFRLEDQLVVGDLLTLANSTSFALFLVLSRRYLQRVDPLGATSWLLALGAAGILGLAAGPLAGVHFGALPARFWWLAAYAIIGATVVTYSLNFYALGHVESSLVALFIYMQPPIATLLSIVFLHERPTLRLYAAGAGIFLAMLLAVWETPLRRRMAEPAERGAELEPLAETVSDSGGRR